MATQGASQSSGGSNAASAVLGAALAGVMVAATAASRTDAIPQHPDLPYQQVAALPETADTLFRRLRAVGSTKPSPVEEAENKRTRFADFQLPEGRRSGDLQRYNTEVRDRTPQRVRA